MVKNDKFWYSSLKSQVADPFITRRREYYHEGWKSGGKGAQNFGRRERVVRKVEGCDPLTPRWPILCY